MKDPKMQPDPSPASPAFFGGDRRMDAAARIFGSSARYFGESDTPELPFPDGLFAAGSSCIVLPFPLTKDGVHLHTPLYNGEPPTLAALAEILAALPENIPVFAGNLPEWMKTALGSRKICLYGEEEGFLAENAALTAAALRLCRILPPSGEGCGIVGFGRVGRAAAKCCLADGIRPAIFCRRTEALTEAVAMGCEAMPLSALPHPILAKLPLLLNTVPAPILSAEMLSGFSGRYGELASRSGLLPGALPTERVLPLPGLPGLLPEAAGAALAAALKRLREKEVPPC